MRRSRIVIGLGLALGIGQAATGARAEGPTYHEDVAAILRGELSGVPPAGPGGTVRAADV